MGKKNKSIFIFIILIFIQTLFIYSNIIMEGIKDKKWDLIGSYFSDTSFLALERKFKNYSKILITKIKDGKLKYYVKYQDNGEIGFITFKRENEKYKNLLIKINFANMQFINNFNKYQVKNRSLQIGDAKLTFLDGFFYIADPVKRLVFFKGTFNLNIAPGDIEEKKTLKYLFKTPVFSIIKKKGIFIFTSDIIDRLISKETRDGIRLSYKDSMFIREQLSYFKNEYGIKIEGFSEHWYSPFADSLNVFIFKKNSAYYKFVYNSDNVPDTYLFEQKTRKHILNYNHIKGMKFFSFYANRVKKIQLYIRLNPYKFKIWSTALLIFPEPANSKSFEIFRDMKIHDFYVENDNGLDYIKNEDRLHIIGKKFKDFSFYYSGKVADTRRKLEIMKYKFDNSYGKLDDFIFFDNVNKFYPNPGNQFFESTLKISIPTNVNCLASGFLKSNKVKNNRNELIFKSDGTKGLTIVCGDFKELDEVNSKIPLKVFGADKVKIKKYFKKKEIKDSFDFLYKLYGRRGIKEVNLLLRRWLSYGGISYKGFVIFNVVKKNIMEVKKTMIEYYKSNPVFLTNDINRDNLIHELAHQWWGGVISWKTYKDVWITEGGAQFSSLLYLESILSAKKFNRIINKILKRIIRDSVSGPIIYGNRIENITGDHNSYQSLIYNKAAMVFFMLRDIIGEKKLFRKINKIFSKYLKKSITTKKFISELVKKEKGNTYLERFLKKWIYSREIPIVNYKIIINKNKSSILFDQKNTDFVFPVRVIIETESNKECKRDVKIVIIKNKSQKIMIERKHIRKIKIERGFSPINLKKK